MKRILLLVLALLLILSLTVSMVACKKDKTPDDPDTQDPSSEQPDTPEDPDTPDTPTEPEEPSDEIVFTTVNETVKATVTVELRVAPAVDVDNVIGNLRVGEIATRTGISADWSRIRVDAEGFDDEYYVSSKCLELYTAPIEPEDPDTPGTPEDPDAPVTDPNEPETPDAPTTDPDGFTPVTPETVYVVVSGLNLRTTPTTADTFNIAGSALIGAALQRTATNGDWSRVTYNGGQYYVYSKYVVTTDITGSNFITLPTPVVTTVTAAQSLHTRTVPFFADDPEIDAETAIGVLLRGNSVTVIAEAPDKSWVRIRMTDGTEAYVNANYLAAYGGATSSPSGSTTTPATIQFKSVEVTAHTKKPGLLSVKAYLTPDVTALQGAIELPDKILVDGHGVDPVTGEEWFRFKKSATDTTYYYVQVAKVVSSDGK